MGVWHPHHCDGKQTEMVGVVAAVYSTLELCSRARDLVGAAVVSKGCANKTVQG